MEVVCHKHFFCLTTHTAVKFLARLVRLYRAAIAAVYHALEPATPSISEWPCMSNLLDKAHVASSKFALTSKSLFSLTQAEKSFERSTAGHRRSVALRPAT